MATKVSSPRPDPQKRLHFESMLADLSSRFINLEAAEIDHEIEKGQCQVCECLDLNLPAPWDVTRPRR
jgi:hypothetical protein